MLVCYFFLFLLIFFSPWTDSRGQQTTPSRKPQSPYSAYIISSSWFDLILFSFPKRPKLSAVSRSRHRASLYEVHTYILARTLQRSARVELFQALPHILRTFFDKNIAESSAFREEQAYRWKKSPCTSLHLGYGN